MAIKTIKTQNKAYTHVTGV